VENNHSADAESLDLTCDAEEGGHDNPKEDFESFNNFVSHESLNITEVIINISFSTCSLFLSVTASFADIDPGSSPFWDLWYRDLD
jgi:hypothetical protein